MHFSGHLQQSQGWVASVATPIRSTGADSSAEITGVAPAAAMSVTTPRQFGGGSDLNFPKFTQEQ